MQAIFAAIVIAFLAGSGLGSWGMYRWFRVDEMSAQINAYKIAQKKTAEALGFTEQQDDEAEAIVKANQEVLDAIAQKKDDAKTLKAALDGVECIDVDSLRDIARLR